jgi:hypothetical protein
MLMSPALFRPEKDCAGEAQQKPKTAGQISRQRGRPTTAIRNRLNIIKERMGENWSRVPDGCLTPRQTDRRSVVI